MNKKNIKFGLLFLIFCFCSFLYLVKAVRLFSIIGMISVAIIYIYFFSANLKQHIKWNSTILVGIVFIIYNLFILIRSFDLNSLYIFIQLSMIVLFVISFYQIKITNNDFENISKKFKYIYYILIAIFSIILFFNKYDLYISIISKTTFKLIIPFSFYVFSDKKNNLIIILYSILITFLLGERTVSIILLFLLLFNYKKNNRVSNKNALLICIILVLFSVFLPKIYVNLSHMDIGIKMNSLLFSYTGEHLFSGRNRLWEIIYNNLENYKYFGLTFNNYILKNMGILVSSHNLFLWFQLCGGYIELCIALLFLINIYKDCVSIVNDRLQRLVISFFIAIILMCSFDLLLFTNNFVISIFMWLALMLPTCISSNDEKEMRKESE